MFPLRKHARNLASVLYRKRLTVFDRLNANVEFNAFARDATSEANCFPDRVSLYRWLSDYLRDEPIDFLEFGVADGASIKVWCSLNSHPGSRFFGFDTFEGLPEDWTSAKPKGTFSNNGKAPEIADARVTFVKGLFQSTLYPFLDHFIPRGRLVVHIDCDLYSGALFCLSVLNQVMKPGSLLLFDEFYDLQNEFAAFKDYVRSFYREAVLLGYTGDPGAAPIIGQAAFKLGGTTRR